MKTVFGETESFGGSKFDHTKRNVDISNRPINLSNKNVRLKCPFLYF